MGGECDRFYSVIAKEVLSVCDHRYAKWLMNISVTRQALSRKKIHTKIFKVNK